MGPCTMQVRDKNVSGMTGRNLLKDLDVDGNIMLKRILKGMGCEVVDRDRVSLWGCSEYGVEVPFVLETGVLDELSK